MLETGPYPAATNGGARGRQGLAASRVLGDTCRRLGDDTIGARSILPWAVEMEARLGPSRRRLQRFISRSGNMGGPEALCGDGNGWIGAGLPLKAEADKVPGDMDFVRQLGWRV